jgi:hypothetical protein
MSQVADRIDPMSAEFQRDVCDFVRREVYYSVSSLIYELRAVADTLDDYDEYLNLQYTADWEEPLEQFIREEATLEQLQEIIDAEDEINDVFSSSDIGGAGLVFDVGMIREGVIRLLDTAARQRYWCDYFGVDPYECEIYEHWLVSGWLAARLREKGHVAVEYLGLTIWGRPTTGQMISMDGVIQQIYAEMMK